MKEQCPFCQSIGTLKAINYRLTVHPVPGEDIDILLPAKQCTYCDEEIETPDLAQRNTELISEAKLEWLVTNIQRKNAIGALIRELRNSLDVTQKEFTAMVGATGNSISKYELHIIEPSAIARNLFILLAKSKHARNELRDLNSTKNNVAAYDLKWQETATHAVPVRWPTYPSAARKPTTKASVFNYMVEVASVTVCGAAAGILGASAIGSLEVLSNIEPAERLSNQPMFNPLFKTYEAGVLNAH
ncbi:hypothetical protein C9422_18585 [Pseudomonas sp. B1(2018)]|uniref:type II TA system antitoxin MqsA family protein n=1 Tax=Pseudomonas sp. B1(2018) TaxID=2233856 RepID=UPI000D5EF54E|nr:type II TA system antitoxin MqsA family protein [Pseudomonas sp. B1(2018)]PVZ56531.1 hypothetical protein C9422_18585 [Pseudomonas sp. B1(2018)]